MLRVAEMVEAVDIMKRNQRDRSTKDYLNFLENPHFIGTEFGAGSREARPVSIDIGQRVAYVPIGGSLFDLGYGTVTEVSGDIAYVKMDDDVKRYGPTAAMPKACRLEFLTDVKEGDE